MIGVSVVLSFHGANRFLQPLDGPKPSAGGLLNGVPSQSAADGGQVSIFE